jgi:predicted nucleic acid-binding protein
LRRIVTDTGPILHLHEANALHLLVEAGEVFIPSAVDVELTRLIPGWDREAAAVRIRALDTSGQRRALAWSDSGVLDPGEAEAVVLALEVDADWFLTDDAALAGLDDLCPPG